MTSDLIGQDRKEEDTETWRSPHGNGGRDWSYAATSPVLGAQDLGGARKDPPREPAGGAARQRLDCGLGPGAGREHLPVC